MSGLEKANAPHPMARFIFLQSVKCGEHDDRPHPMMTAKIPSAPIVPLFLSICVLPLAHDILPLGLSDPSENRILCFGVLSRVLLSVVGHTYLSLGE